MWGCCGDSGLGDAKRIVTISLKWQLVHLGSGSTVTCPRFDRIHVGLCFLLLHGQVGVLTHLGATDKTMTSPTITYR